MFKWLGIDVLLFDVFGVGVDLFGGFDLCVIEGDLVEVVDVLFVIVDCYGCGFDIYLYECGLMGVYLFDLIL